MGRKRDPIDNDGPVGKFAKRLRDRMDQNPDLTFRKIAAQVNYSHSTLALAASGKKFPTWASTLALLQGCGADENEITWWRSYWENTRRKIGGPAHREDGDPVDEDQWGVPLVEPRGYQEWRPRPDLVETFEDLTYELKRFRIAVGNPSIRQLHRDMNRHLWGTQCSLAVLSDVLAGRRRPRAAIFRAILGALLIQAHSIHGLSEKGQGWLSEVEWIGAWSRAEFRRENLGPPPSRDVLNEVLPPHDRGGVSISKMAEKKPRLAAALLTDMSPKVVSGIITALPPDAAEPMLTAVLEDHSRKLRASKRSGPGGW